MIQNSTTVRFLNNKILRTEVLTVMKVLYVSCWDLTFFENLCSIFIYYEPQQNPFYMKD